MAFKKILLSNEALIKVIEGIAELTSAVKVTLGPNGKNVILQSKKGVSITKDGISILKEIELEDPFKNAGAKLVREASAKTASNSGDGTTSATLLTHALCVEGLKGKIAGRVLPEIEKLPNSEEGNGNK